MRRASNADQWTFTCHSPTHCTLGRGTSKVEVHLVSWPLHLMSKNNVFPHFGSPNSLPHRANATKLVRTFHTRTLTFHFSWLRSWIPDSDLVAVLSIFVSYQSRLHLSPSFLCNRSWDHDLSWAEWMIFILRSNPWASRLSPFLNPHPLISRLLPSLLELGLVQSYAPHSV